MVDNRHDPAIGQPGPTPGRLNAVQRHFHVRNSLSVAILLAVLVLGLAECGTSPSTSPTTSSTARAKTISLPTVVGMFTTEATEELHNAGLRTDTANASYSNIAPLGMVMNQQPVPQSKVAKGSTVTLAKSLGPSPAPGT
jgi:hypothetical protein